MLEWTRWKKAYPGSCIYGDWLLCVVKKWKGQICMKITSFTIGPIWSPGNGNVEAWIEPHATEQWAFSPCKAKRAEHAWPHTENERFGRWPVWPSEAEALGVGFQKTIPGVNGLRIAVPICEHVHVCHLILPVPPHQKHAQKFDWLRVYCSTNWVKVDLFHLSWTQFFYWPGVITWRVDKIHVTLPMRH